MNDNNRKSVTKAKNTTGGIIAMIVIVLVLNLIELAGDSGTMDIYFIISLVIGVSVLAGVIAVAVGAIKAARKRITGQGSTSGLKNRDAELEDKVYIPRYENTPSKAYYESSDVFDNRERDKQRRIQQLKVFLKNGIIEKEEYELLLRRYERDI